MPTEIKTNMKDNTLFEFWGGNLRGVCILVSSVDGRDGASHITLTMEDAAALCADLSAFVKREAQRRQALLKDELERLKIAERTVFHEITEIPANEFMTSALFSVKAVSFLCPKYDKSTQEAKQSEKIS